jgi:hypothetical protein
LNLYRSSCVILVIVPWLFGACGSEDPGREPSNAGSSGAGRGGGAGTGGGQPTSGGAAGEPASGDAGDGGVDGVGGAAGEPATNGGQGGDSAGQAGAGNAAGEAGAPSVLEPLLPWKEGYSWTYEVNEGGTISTKTTTVGPLELVGGSGPSKTLMANRVVTAKGTNGNDETRSWQAVMGDRVLRYREQSFSAATGDLQQEEHWDPYKIHIDGTPSRTVTGAAWTESYDETKLPVGMAPVTAPVNDGWTCLAEAESITVPAGTFTTVVFKKTSQTGVSKTYNYARGVGKVKEVGAQVEQLVSYDVE